MVNQTGGRCAVTSCRTPHDRVEAHHIHPIGARRRPARTRRRRGVLWQTDRVKQPRELSGWWQAAFGTVIAMVATLLVQVADAPVGLGGVLVGAAVGGTASRGIGSLVGHGPTRTIVESESRPADEGAAGSVRVTGAFGQQQPSYGPHVGGTSPPSGSHAVFRAPFSQVAVGRNYTAPIPPAAPPSLPEPPPLRFRSMRCASAARFRVKRSGLSARRAARRRIQRSFTARN